MKPKSLHSVLRSQSSHRFSTILTSALAALSANHSTQAASATWNASPTNGVWEAAGAENNWLTGPGTFPGALNAITGFDVANFLTSSVTTVTINSTAGNTSPLGIGSITFGAVASPSAFTIGTVGGNSLLLANGGSIAILSGSTVEGAIQTINAPLVLQPASNSTAGTYSFNNASSLTGSILKIGGTVTGGTTTSAITLILTGSNTSANEISGVVSDGGAGSGLAISKTGVGTWILSGANSYTGSTTVNAGILSLSGSAGSLALSASPVVLNGGEFRLNNQGVGGNNLSRIADTQAFTFNGGQLTFIGSDQTGTDASETIGAVTLGTGTTTSGAPQSLISIQNPTGGTANVNILSMASLTRSAGSVAALVNGNNLGKDSASVSDVQRILVTAAPTLVGTSDGAATGIDSAVKNTKIVPFLVGEATATTGGFGTATGTANTFLTWNATTGLRPLNPTDEYTRNSISAASAGHNTYIAAATTVTAGAAINSLVINGGNLTINTGQTVTNTSGALLFASTHSILGSAAAASTLAFGSAEALITVNAGVTATISGTTNIVNLSGSGGLTKNGTGTLVLRTPTSINTNQSLTGPINIKQGTINAWATGGFVFPTASAINVATGATMLQTDHAGGTNVNLANPYTISGFGSGGMGAINHFNSGGFSYTNTISLAADAGIRTQPESQSTYTTGTGVLANAITFSNVISSPAGVTSGLTLFAQQGAAVAGVPNFSLSGASTYTGSTILTSSQNGTSGNPFIIQLSGGTNRLPAATNLIFGGNPAGVAGTFNANVALLLNGISQTVADISVASGATGAYSVRGTNATASTFVVNNAVANTFNGTLGGTAFNNNNLALTKSGAGLLTLGGNNTFTGGVSLSAGSGGIRLTSGTALGPAATVKTISLPSTLNGTIELTNDITVAGKTLSMGGRGLFTSAAHLRNVSGDNAWNGNITMATTGGGYVVHLLAGNLTLGGTLTNTASADARVLTFIGGGNATFNGIAQDNVSNLVGFSMAGSGILTISGQNTHKGTTFISAGTVKVGNSLAFTSTNPLNLSGSGIFDLNGFDAGITNVSASAATNLITDNGTTPGTSTLTVSNFSNTIVSLVKDGAARALALSISNVATPNTLFTTANQNTFSGGLTLLHGTGSGTRLRISSLLTTTGSPGAIVSGPYGTGPIRIGESAVDRAGILIDTVANNSLKNAIVFNTALGNDEPGIRIDNTATGVTLSGTITANLAAATFSSPANHTTVANLTGQITGPAGLSVGNEVAGSLTVVLNNTTANPNNYQGATLINGANGILTLAAANQIPDGAGAGNVTVNGKLNLGGFNETINGLNGSGTVDNITGTSNLTVGANNAAGAFSGVIQNTIGTLALTKIGAGLLDLQGPNTYDGATTVSNGTLLINGNMNTATGAVSVASGATLGGSGTVGGATTIASGGIHAPGNSPGVQDFTDLTYADGSIFAWDIDRTGNQALRGNGYDGVNVSGTLAGLDGGDENSTFDAVFRVVIGDADFSNAFWEDGHTWSDIFTSNGSTAIANWTSIFGGGIKTFTGGGVEITDTATYGSFSFSPGTNSLSWSAVPEPSSALAGLLLASGLLRRRRLA